MSNDIEVWLVVPSLPEYEVSSEGRVRRIPYMAPMPYGGMRQYGGKEHCGVWNKKDKRYQFVFRGKTYKIAPFVCEAFNGPRSILKPYCLHIDENSKNNKPENLMWGTQKENLNAPGFIKYCKGRTGKNNPRIKGMQFTSVA